MYYEIKCPVIIDNMMNLELLFEATAFTGDSTFYNIAVKHADTTMANHFRVNNRPVSSLREDAECIGDVFSKAGYDCAYFGKLHADFPTPNDPEHPGQYVEEKSPVWDAYTPKDRRHGFNHWYSYGTFDDLKDPYQLRNLSLEENQEIVKQLYDEMGVLLKEIKDPWYTEKILADRILY